ncbi:MAG: hypothetical protein E2O95_00525 [Acidobacteria bacterium]|nr:MAG: hypothetical protein E2O95_00525 [Acidobacteriota bacterium]
MQRNLISMIRGLFAQGESATKTAASDKPNAQVAILSMPSWAGRRVRHQVQVIDRKPDSATVWSPEYVDVKETVWIEDAGRAVRCSVNEYVATGGGYRLHLSITGDSRRFKERIPCNSPGDLEWVEGLTRVRCPVRVTNETTDGVQLTLSRPAPEIRSVRLQYNGTTKTGTIRYCVQIGASYLVGVEFV